jgi:hypothetical protein
LGVKFVVLLLLGSFHLAAQDLRETIVADAYLGLSIDTFSARELRGILYQNPQDNGTQRQRVVGGFNLAYRLAGSTSNSLAPQLWIYGQSRHGARSAEMTSVTGTPGQQFVYLLRNASSLEAHLGLRLEFLTLNAGRRDAARVYLKAQAGFLSLAQSGGDVFDAHRIALGLLASSGRYEGSFLEAGYGRNDVFRLNRYRRIVVSGYLTWGAERWRERGIRPFVSIAVDGDAGIGADSVQTSIGLSFDVDRIF